MISKSSSSFLHNLIKLKKPYIPKNTPYNKNNFNSSNINSNSFNYKFSLPTTTTTNELNINNNNSNKIKNNNIYKNNLVYNYQKLNNNGLVNSGYRQFASKNKFHSTLKNSSRVNNSNNNSRAKFGDIVRNDGIGIIDLEYESYLKQMEKNMSLSLFLKNTYISTSLGFAGSVLSGLILSHFVSPTATLGVALLGLVGSIGSIMIFNSQTPKFDRIDAIYEKKDGNFTEKNIVQLVVPQYPPSMVAAFIGLCVSNGLVMSGLLAMTPGIVVLKALVAGGIVSGASSYFALRMRPESMQAYRPVLYGSLFGLIGLSLLSMGSHLIFGPNVFTDTVFSIDCYGGLALFTALNMLDTQEAVREFNETGKPDFLKCSISLVMNAVNIFIRLIHVFRDSDR